MLITNDTISFLALFVFFVFVCRFFFFSFVFFLALELHDGNRMPRLFIISYEAIIIRTRTERTRGRTACRLFDLSDGKASNR